MQSCSLRCLCITAVKRRFKLERLCKNPSRLPVKIPLCIRSNLWMLEPSPKRCAMHVQHAGNLLDLVPLPQQAYSLFLFIRDLIHSRHPFKAECADDSIKSRAAGGVPIYESAPRLFQYPLYPGDTGWGCADRRSMDSLRLPAHRQSRQDEAADRRAAPVAAPPSQRLRAAPAPAACSACRPCLHSPAADRGPLALAAARLHKPRRRRSFFASLVNA